MGFSSPPYVIWVQSVGVIGMLEGGDLFWWRRWSVVAWMAYLRSLEVLLGSSSSIEQMLWYHNPQISVTNFGLISKLFISQSLVSFLLILLDQSCPYNNNKGWKHCHKVFVPPSLLHAATKKTREFHCVIAKSCCISEYEPLLKVFYALLCYWKADLIAIDEGAC